MLLRPGSALLCHAPRWSWGGVRRINSCPLGPGPAVLHRHRVSSITPSPPRPLPRPQKGSPKPRRGRAQIKGNWPSPQARPCPTPPHAGPGCIAAHPEPEPRTSGHQATALPWRGQSGRAGWLATGGTSTGPLASRAEPRPCPTVPFSSCSFQGRQAASSSRWLAAPRGVWA